MTEIMYPRCPMCPSLKPLMLDTRDITMIFKGESHTIKDITAYFCDACNDSIHGHSTDPDDKFGKELIRIHQEVRLRQLAELPLSSVVDIIDDLKHYLPDYRSLIDPSVNVRVRFFCEKVRDPDYDLDPENLSEYRPDGKIVYKILESEYEQYKIKELYN